MWHRRLLYSLPSEKKRKKVIGPRVNSLTNLCSTLRSPIVVYFYPTLIVGEKKVLWSHNDMHKRL